MNSTTPLAPTAKDDQEKAKAFDRLIHDLGAKLPVESRIKKLYGLPLAEALEDFVIVSRAEWEQRKEGK